MVWGTCSSETSIAFNGLQGDLSQKNRTFRKQIESYIEGQDQILRPFMAHRGTNHSLAQDILPVKCLSERSPLWSSGQSFWLQIQRFGFEPRRYQIFWEVVGLERRPLSLVSTTEELLGRKSSSFGLEGREYGRRDPSRWSRDSLYP
jgi:hypothetical protein